MSVLSTLGLDPLALLKHTQLMQVLSTDIVTGGKVADCRQYALKKSEAARPF